MWKGPRFGSGSRNQARPPRPPANRSLAAGRIYRQGRSAAAAVPDLHGIWAYPLAGPQRRSSHTGYHCRDGHPDFPFTAQDISFTYPDSMISRLLADQKDPDYYLPDYHGRLFTLPEMVSIVASNGLPGITWGNNLPPTLANYIEAQVWNQQILLILCIFPIIAMLTKELDSR